MFFHNVPPDEFCCDASVKFVYDCLFGTSEVIYFFSF